MVSSQAELIADMAQAKRLPIMVQQRASVAKGALSSYGVDFYTVGLYRSRFLGQARGI